MIARTFIAILSFCLLLIVMIPQTSHSSTRRLVNQAVALFNQGDYATAIKLLEDAESRMVDPQDIKELLGEAHLGLAYQALQAGDYDKAIGAFAAAEGSLSEDSRLWQGKAVALFHQGQYDAAETALQYAVAIEPGQPRLYLLLGQVQYAAGRMYEARESLRQARELGGAEGVDEMLAKVEREWQLEQGMEHDLSGVFRISFADNGQSDLATVILETLDDAYAELGAEIEFYPDIEVPVLLYGRREFEAVTRSPDWAGAAYDGKIRIPLGGVTRMTPQLRGLLYHEYAHVMIRFLGKGRVPTWINEGFAELAGRRYHDPGLDHLEGAAVAGSLLSWDRLALSFKDLSTEQAKLAYEQSYSFCSYLVEMFGWFYFKDLIERLADGDDVATAFAATYGEYGMDLAKLQRYWQDSL